MPNRLPDASALAPRERDTATREFPETLTEVDGGVMAGRN